MWSRALCISSGWPLGRVKKNTRHHLPTDLDQCVCKCMPQVHLQTHWLSLTCEPITTPAQPPETLSVTPEYCRFASGVSVTTKSWHDNPPATCQTCVCAHLRTSAFLYYICFCIKQTLSDAFKLFISETLAHVFVHSGYLFSRSQSPSVPLMSWLGVHFSVRLSPAWWRDK